MFPVCECGNVPVARRLLVQGAPTAVSVGFLLAAPTINPVVFWATWVAFRGQPEIVFMRVGFTLLIATTVGWVFSRQADIGPFLQTSVARSRFRDRTAKPVQRQLGFATGRDFFADGWRGHLRLDTPVAQRLVANPAVEQCCRISFGWRLTIWCVSCENWGQCWCWAVRSRQLFKLLSRES